MWSQVRGCGEYKRYVNFTVNTRIKTLQISFYSFWGFFNDHVDCPSGKTEKLHSLHADLFVIVT